MPPRVENSEDFRDSVLERILISRWAIPLAWGAMLGVQLSAFLPPGLAWLVGLANELGGADGASLTLAYVLGSVGSLALGVMAGSARAMTKDEIARSGAEPWRQRAARLALRRGELVDDAEANRLAAVQAQKHLGVSHNHRWTRAAQVMFGFFAFTQLLACVFAVLDGDVSGMFLHGGVGFGMTCFAAVLLPGELRTFRRSRRVVALQAVEHLHARGLEPASGHRHV